MSGDMCDEFLVDDDTIDSVRKQLKSEEVFYRLADTFKVLGDPTRVKILYALGLEELCVCDLSTLLGISQSTTSHQLRVLRNLRLVKHHREGRSIFYSLDDDHIRTLFDEGLKHVEE